MSSPDGRPTDDEMPPVDLDEIDSLDLMYRAELARGHKRDIAKRFPDDPDLVPMAEWHRGHNIHVVALPGGCGDVAHLIEWAKGNIGPPTAMVLIADTFMSNPQYPRDDRVDEAIVVVIAKPGSCVATLDPYKIINGQVHFASELPVPWDYLHNLLEGVPALMAAVFDE